MTHDHHKRYLPPAECSTLHTTLTCKELKRRRRRPFLMPIYYDKGTISNLPPDSVFSKCLTSHMDRARPRGVQPTVCLAVTLGQRARRELRRQLRPRLFLVKFKYGSPDPYQETTFRHSQSSRMYDLSEFCRLRTEASEASLNTCLLLVTDPAEQWKPIPSLVKCWQLTLEPRAPYVITVPPIHTRTHTHTNGPNTVDNRAKCLQGQPSWLAHKSEICRGEPSSYRVAKPRSSERGAKVGGGRTWSQVRPNWRP